MAKCRHWPVALGLLAALLACGQERHTPPPRDATSAAADLRQRCTDSIDCEAGYHCTVDGLCVEKRAPPCESDYDCERGQLCFKQGHDRVGICAAPVNGWGMPAPAYKNPWSHLPGPVAGRSCGWDLECPPKYECQRRPNELNGICVEKKP